MSDGGKTEGIAHPFGGQRTKLQSISDFRNEILTEPEACEKLVMQNGQAGEFSELRAQQM